MKLCCTSVMLPRWTLDETFDKLAECGYDAVELRCRYNPDEDSAPAFWGRHLSDVSPDNIVDKAPAMRAAAVRSGVRVAALRTQVPDRRGGGDPQALCWGRGLRRRSAAAYTHRRAVP